MFLKSLMIIFDTHGFIDNQVIISCFSPVSVHLEILVKRLLRLLYKNQ